MAESVIDLAATAVRPYGKNTYKPQAFEHIYTCNTGQLIPAFATTLINPGSTYSITTSILARLNTSRYPTIARGWIEYAWFYVPHSQIWDHWYEFMGENTESAWVSSTTYSIPQLTVAAGVQVQSGSLLDHFGWRIGTSDFSASALKVRAYNWIIDQYYRDQNIEAPYAPDTSDNALAYSATGDWTVGNTPYSINRKADVFSTALPEPQRAAASASIPVSLGVAPVKTSSDTHTYTGQVLQFWNSSTGLKPSNNTAIANAAGDLKTASFASAGALTTSQPLEPSNLWADFSNGSVSFDIMSMRESVVAQHIWERDARSGNRAPEQLWATWSVEVDVLELGRPRLLNLNRFPIDFEQVPQTSASDATSPQGTLTAFGYTNNRSDNETFSFKYAGTLMCLVAIRFEHKYQQGMPVDDLKKDRFDFWDPMMAGLGDQGIPSAALYATGGSTGTIMNADTDLFGYGERAWEYKNFQSIITGQARSEYSQPMDYVHLADLYTSKPTLSQNWMKENPDNLDRSIFVTSTLANQWLVDFVAEFEITDTIPLYSIPGVDRL